MRISVNKLKALCHDRAMGVTDLLEKSGISRNAFYSMARKKSVLPRSIVAIAEALNVSVSAFMDVDSTPEERIRRLQKRVERLQSRHKNVDPDNIRHTLQLLDEKPVDRLRRALARAQRFDFQ